MAEKYEDMLKADLIRLCYEKDEEIATLRQQIEELKTAKEEAEQAELMVGILFSEDEVKSRLQKEIEALSEQKSRIQARIREVQNSGVLTDFEKNKLVVEYNKQVSSIDEVIQEITSILNNLEGGRE